MFTTRYHSVTQLCFDIMVNVLPLCWRAWTQLGAVMRNNVCSVCVQAAEVRQTLEQPERHTASLIPPAAWIRLSRFIIIGSEDDLLKTSKQKTVLTCTLINVSICAFILLNMTKDKCY